MHLTIKKIHIYITWYIQFCLYYTRSSKLAKHYTHSWVFSPIQIHKQFQVIYFIYMTIIWCYIVQNLSFWLNWKHSCSLALFKIHWWCKVKLHSYTFWSNRTQYCKNGHNYIDFTLNCQIKHYMNKITNMHLIKNRFIIYYYHYH